MATTVDILSIYKNLYNQLLKVQHAFNLEKLMIYVRTYISQITSISSHLNSEWKFLLSTSVFQGLNVAYSAF